MEQELKETTAKTYYDIAEELFGEEKESWCIIGDSIPCVLTSALFDIPDKAVRCTSHKQTQKVIAINCLLNVAKYLNGEWKTDWDDASEPKFSFFIDPTNDLAIVTEYDKLHHIVYFRTKKLAKRAIDILGEDTIRLALSTDY